MRNVDNKAIRILSCYDRLRKGFVLQKEELADEFKMTPKAIQRYLNEIRGHIPEHTYARPGEADLTTQSGAAARGV